MGNYVPLTLGQRDCTTGYLWVPSGPVLDVLLVGRKSPKKPPEWLATANCTPQNCWRLSNRAGLGLRITLAYGEG